MSVQLPRWCGTQLEKPIPLYLAAPRVPAWDLHDPEERERRISKDIKGAQGLLPALSRRSNHEALDQRISLPGLWATLIPQGLNLYLPPLYRWLLVHTSECGGNNKLLGSMFEKQAIGSVD